MKVISRINSGLSEAFFVLTVMLLGILFSMDFSLAMVKTTSQDFIEEEECTAVTEATQRLAVVKPFRFCIQTLSSISQSGPENCG